MLPAIACKASFVSREMPVPPKTTLAMLPEIDGEFVSQGRLEVQEAERILPRLESSKVRFRISTDLATRRNFRSPLGDPRVELFVHSADVGAWQRIRGEFFRV